MIDLGYWALSSYSYWQTTNHSCCCGGCVEANNEGYIDTTVPTRNANPSSNCTDTHNGYTQQGTSCYAYYWYVGLTGCFFNLFDCCFTTCTYYRDYYIAYYNVWVPSWRTNYNILKYQYGNWNLIGTAYVDTGSSPVFI